MDEECTIVGAGIFGLSTALRIRRECKMEVTVLMPQPAPNVIPLMDSLRNHQWGQSGALYDQLEKTVAEKMRLSLREMHTAVGYPLPDPNRHGVFRVDDASEAALITNAKRLGLQIALLPENDSRRLLRYLYLPGKHYATPDQPFDEAGLLQAARKVAEEEGIRFRAAEVVKLVEDGGSKCGLTLVLRIDGEPARLVNWRSDYVVLCAGSMIPGLLDTISARHPLKVFQSALLTIDNNRYLDAPLFVDRVLDLSIVRHPVMPGVLPSGALVIGGRHREPVDDPSARREVSDHEKRALARLMPVSLWHTALSGTATAGHKTERVDPTGKSSVKPFVANVPGHDRVLYGVPGKATLAYWAAGLVVAKLKRLQRFRSPGSSELDNQDSAHRQGANQDLPQLKFEYRMHHTMGIDETRPVPVDQVKKK